LSYYIARWYDNRRGRFIQPDAIVPNPGDPQSLNRYAYVLNNPLRYTDPTGFFSEEEIMAYLGVETWEEVLAMFGEGGIFEGAWGFLALLLDAELGDNISWWTKSEAGFSSRIRGNFFESDTGTLMFKGLVGRGHINWSVFDFGKAISRVVQGGKDNSWLQINSTVFLASFKYERLKYDWNKVNKTALGLALIGLGADAISLGAGGRVADMAAKVGRGSDIAGMAQSVPTAINLALQGDMSEQANEGLC